MPRRAWLTPHNLPASYSWRAILVPNDSPLSHTAFEAIMRGALLPTVSPENWEQLEDTHLTPTEAVDIFDRVLESFLMGYPVLPAGTVQAFAGDIIPAGWLKCSGQAVDKAAYPLLYAAIGDIYGTPSSPDWFLLPDLGARTIVGTHNTAGPNQSRRIIGDVGGEEAHTLTIDEMPSHSHIQDFVFGAGTAVGEQLTGNPGGDFGDLADKPVGGGQPHNNMPPFVALHYIIFTGEFPSP